MNNAINRPGRGPHQNGRIRTLADIAVHLTWRHRRKNQKLLRNQLDHDDVDQILHELRGMIYKYESLRPKKND